MTGVHITPVQVGNNSAGVSEVSVTVNRSSCTPGSSSEVARKIVTPRDMHRGVTITPIQPAQQKQVIEKALLKAVSKKAGKKTQSGAKTFILRSIRVSMVTSCSHLKDLIRKQLGEEIIKTDFDVGYLQGSNVIIMRNQTDVLELWSNLQKGFNTVMWCDGLFVKQSKTSTSRKRSMDSDSDDEEHSTKKTKKEEKDSAVKKCIEDLNTTHKEKYTPMQYRIWAEMKCSGLHDSMTTPPVTSMFVRAGGSTPKKATSATDTVSQAICQLASALTPKAPSVASSPANVIEYRSKCYHQLAELKNLAESSLLSEEEYSLERQAIMDTLHKLQEK